MSQVTYNQSGYVGQSMSVRARAAYNAGEQPKSYWTKEAIISEVTSISDKFTEEQLNKYLKHTLEVFFLKFSSWHHTGKYACETDFYKISVDKFTTLERLNRCDADERAERKEKKKVRPQKGYIRYEEWEGTRNYGKFIQYEEHCLIIGNQAYLRSGKRKNIYGSHILKIERYDRAPRNTAKIYKKLEYSLPKKYR